MNLAADKIPQVGQTQASHSNVFQTPWIKKKKLYLIHNQDGTVTAKVAAKNLLQQFAGLFQKPTKETADDFSDKNQTIIEEKTFFDVKTPRFELEKLQLQKLINENASIQTLLKKIENDFKSALSQPPEAFQIPLSAHLDAKHAATQPKPAMLTAQQMADRHDKLQGLRSELEALLVLIEEQNKSKELKAYETLQASTQKIEGFVHDTFAAIGALEQRLTNPELSFEEFLEATKGIGKDRAAWDNEMTAIKRAFQEDRLIRQELLNFEKELIPFSIAIKEAWMKHKREWLAEFAPKKLSPSMDMEPRRQRMKEICHAIRQQSLDELNQAIGNEQTLLGQALMKPVSAPLRPGKQQAFTLFKKTALTLRQQTWKRLAASQPPLSIKEIAAWQKEIKQEQRHNLMWIKWLNEIPAAPGYFSTFFSSIVHPMETLSRLSGKPQLSSYLLEQQTFDEAALAHLQKTLAIIEETRNEIKDGSNPTISQKKLERYQEFLNFILETRHLRAQDFAAQLKKAQPKLFNTDTHHAILTAAQSIATGIADRLGEKNLHKETGAEWKQARLSVAEDLKTLHHLETLETDYRKYTFLLETTREKIGKLTGQEKQMATEALDIFAQSLASLDIGTPLEKINEKVIHAYSQNVSHLTHYINEIFHQEQEKIAQKGHISKDIDHCIHFFDSLLTQVAEIERFYSYQLTSIKEQLEQKKSTLLQLKTKNTLKPTRWFWFFQSTSKENVEELSINELAHYREKVQKEIFTETQHALSFHISPLANSLKALQKEHKELEDHARSLTTVLKFHPIPGASQVPQYLRAVQHQETLKHMLTRQRSEIKSAKDLNQVRAHVQEDIATLKSCLESSKKAKSLSLAKQITQLHEYPIEQNLAKQAFIDMLSSQMSAHSTEMNDKLKHLASTPSIFDETIDFVHDTKGDLLTKIDNLPEPLKAHASNWFPIGSNAKFNPPNMTVDALSLSDLKEYSTYIKETIAAGAVRMSSIHDAYQQAKEGDRILQQKIHAAKRQLDVLGRNDQLLTKKALETVITDVEQTRAQEPDITQLGYVATVSRTVQGAFSSSLITINDYKHHIGQLTSILESALKDASKITLTIPQQLEQKPDEETAIALRERFYEKTVPFLNEAKQALDDYQKENFEIYGTYVNRECSLYQNAIKVVDEQQKILKSFYTSYTPLTEIAIRGDRPEEDSLWMPAGGWSTAHFASILGSAFFLGGNVEPAEGWLTPLTIGKIGLPIIALLGGYLRYSQQEGKKLPDAGKRSQEETDASTAAYYLTTLASSYLAINKFSPFQDFGSSSTIAKIVLPIIGAIGLRHMVSPETRARIVSSAYYGSLVGIAYHAKNLAAVMEMPFGYPDIVSFPPVADFIHFLKQTCPRIKSPFNPLPAMCPASPSLTTNQLYLSLAGLASVLLPSAQGWLTKKFRGLHTTSLAELPPKDMNKYARDVKRLQSVLVDNATLTIDTKYSVETLAIAHNKYEQAKKDALSQVARLKEKDHHVEAYQLEYAAYIASLEIEQWKVGQGEFWRSPVTDASKLEALLEALKTVTTQLDSSMDKWIVTTAPTAFTDQLEALLTHKAQHSSYSEQLTGMAAAETCPEPDIAKTIDALKNKIITSIDSKHSAFHEELHGLYQELTPLFTKYSIHFPTKKQVAKVVQREIEVFSRPQDTTFSTEGRIWNTRKTIEEMSPGEIIKYRPEALTDDFIDASKKRIKNVFSYEEILSGHRAYKEALSAAEQAKIDLEQDQRISHAGELNDKIYDIEQAVKTKAKTPIYTAPDLEKFGHFLEQQARTLRIAQGDILSYHKIPASEQIDQLDPDGPFVNKLITSLRKEIETSLADHKKKITQHVATVQKIVETLGCPKAWLKTIKEKLKEHQKKMEKAVEPLEATSRGWLGGTFKSKTSLAKMSMQQLGTVQKNLKAAASPIEDTAEAFHLSRLQTQQEHYDAQIASINKLLKTSRKDKKVDAVQRLEALKTAASTKLQKYFVDEANADVATAISELILLLGELTTELYDGLRTVQTEEPTSIATLMQSEPVDSPKYRQLKRDLQQDIKKKIDAKTKDLKAYQKNLDTVQKSLDALEGSRASIPERWRQLLLGNIHEKQLLLSDLTKGLPIIVDGQVTGYKPFDSLDKQELLTYETLVEQLAGKPDKILKNLEARAQLKKLATSLTTWTSARVSLKYATTDVHASDDQKKWRSSCLESNDRLIAAVCKDLKELNDADLLIKTLDQTETSFLYAYRQKSYAMDDNWDPWSLLLHKEAANENPYEKKQDVAKHIEKIRTGVIQLDTGADPHNARQPISNLEDIIKDGVKEITRKIEQATQIREEIAKDAHQNSPELQAWDTTIVSLQQNIETLKGLDQQFSFKDETGRETPIQVSKIATFKELLAYRQTIYTTKTKSLNLFDNTNDTHFVSMTLSSLNRKNAQDDNIDVDFDIPPPRPDNDERKDPDIGDGGNAVDDGGGALSPPIQRPLPQARVPMPIATASALETSVSQLKTKVHTLQQELRTQPNLANLDIGKMTLKGFGRVDQNKKIELKNVLQATRQQAEATRSSLNNFLGNDDAKVPGIQPAAHNGVPPADLPAALSQQIQLALQAPPPASTIADEITDFERLTAAQAAKEAWLTTKEVRFTIDGLKNEINTFFNEFTGALTQLQSLTPQQQQSPWIKVLKKAQAPYANIFAVLNNTQEYKLLTVDPYKHNNHQSLENLRKTKTAILTLNATILKESPKITGNVTDQQAKHSSHLLVAINEMLTVLDIQSNKVKFETDLTAFTQAVNNTNEEIQKQVSRTAKGHLADATRAGVNKVEAQFTDKQLEERARKFFDEYEKLSKAIINNNLSPDLLEDFTQHRRFVQGHIKLTDSNKARVKEGIIRAEALMEEDRIALTVLEIPQHLNENLPIQQILLNQLLALNPAPNPAPLFYIDALNASTKDLQMSMNGLTTGFRDSTFIAFKQKAQQVQKKYAYYQTCLQQAQQAKTNPKMSQPLHQLREDAKHPGILADNSKKALLSQVNRWAAIRLHKMMEKRGEILAIHKDHFAGIAPLPLAILANITEAMAFYANQA